MQKLFDEINVISTEEAQRKQGHAINRYAHEHQQSE
jgi:hypothetical protein